MTVKPAITPTLQVVTATLRGTLLTVSGAHWFPRQRLTISISSTAEISEVIRLGIVTVDRKGSFVFTLRLTKVIGPAPHIIVASFTHKESVPINIMPVFKRSWVNNGAKAR
jgi:hypothetical protein